jgi:hypothetical protein
VLNRSFEGLTECSVYVRQTDLAMSGTRGVVQGGAVCAGFGVSAGAAVAGATSKEVAARPRTEALRAARLQADPRSKRDLMVAWLGGKQLGPECLGAEWLEAEWLEAEWFEAGHLDRPRVLFED